MAIKVQITFDCADPQRLADFWALALDYRPQDPPEGFSSWEEWLTAHNIPPDQWNSAASVVDPQDQGPRLFFQRVPEPKTAKNRVHLDLGAGVGAPDLEERAALARAHAAKLVEAGGRLLYEKTEYGQFWLTLADPEGNEFCIS